LGLLEVGRVKALSEPAIDLCQQVSGLLALALALGHDEGLLEAGFGCLRLWELQ